MTERNNASDSMGNGCAVSADSGTLFQALFEQAAIGMARISLDSNIVTVNNAFARMLGYDPGQLAGKTILDITHPEDRDKSSALVDQIRSNPARTMIIEKRYLHRNGSTIWGRAHCCVICDADGSPREFAAQIEDVTEWIETRQALERAKQESESANRAKSKFLGNMSHELRTPLNGIIGMTQIVLSSDLSGEQREHLEIVLRASRNLLGAVNRLLELSSLEGSTMPVEHKPFPVRKKLSSLLESLAQEAKAKGLGFSYSFGAGVPQTLVGDLEKIGHALLNVADNAIKFTQKGGVSIGITCDCDDVAARCGGGDSTGEVVLRISVKDTGPGVDREMQEKIFEPFSLAEDLLTKRYGGIGLGLAVAKQLVERMGGRIWVRSKPGQGSAFFFTCPCRQAIAVPEPARREEKPAWNGQRPRRILLVEDEPINQEVTSRLLQKGGYDVSLAEDGIEAIEALELEEFDLVLMDIQMPRMNGLDTARSIRHGGSGKLSRNIPIIGLSAFAGGTHRQKALEAGMDDFLAKPFEYQKLLKIIRETLEAHMG